MGVCFKLASKPCREKDRNKCEDFLSSCLAKTRVHYFGGFEGQTLSVACWVISENVASLGIQHCQLDGTRSPGDSLMKLSSVRLCKHGIYAPTSCVCLCGVVF